MFTAEGTGKNIEQAIENALFELKASREDVDIKILNEGGLFKKAKVVVTISEDAKEKYQKKFASRKAEKEDKSDENKKEVSQKETNLQNKEAKSKEIKETEKTVSMQENSEKTDNEIDDKLVTEKIEEREIDLSESSDDVCMDAMEFLKGLFEVAGKQVEINVTEDEKYITYSVVGENLGDMIGHRGDCYYAINRILSAVTGRQEKRILLDIGGFKEKRVESLTKLAQRMADRVAKSGRYARLDPMNPSDRRIIHSALSEDGRVVTLSKGEEPKRYVMIFPKDDE